MDTAWVAKLEVNDQTPYLTVLAGVLLRFFTGDKGVCRLDVDLQEIAEGIGYACGIETRKPVKIILQVDEDVSLLVKACRATMEQEHPLIVIPVFTGIYDIENGLAAHDLRIIDCSPLPLEGLEDSFLQAMGIARDVYNRDAYMKSLLHACRGYPHCAVELVEAHHTRRSTIATHCCF